MISTWLEAGVQYAKGGESQRGVGGMRGRSIIEFGITGEILIVLVRGNLDGGGLMLIDWADQSVSCFECYLMHVLHCQ